MLKIKKHLPNSSTGTVLFLHGFTESSQCFNEAWYLSEFSNFNIFMVDLPGFGESDFTEPVNVISIIDFIYEDICKTHNLAFPLYIIGHSLGGTLAALLLEKSIQINKKCFLINVDGLIIPEQKGASSLAFSVEYTLSQAYKDFVIKYWSSRIGQDVFLQRYLKNIQNTSATVLHGWAKTIVSLLASANLLELLLRFKSNVIYLYGKESVNKRNINAAIESGITCIEIAETGHWPMLEKPGLFWKNVIECINKFAQTCLIASTSQLLY